MKRRCEAMLCYAMTLGVDESFVIEICYRELGFDLKRSEAMRSDAKRCEAMRSDAKRCEAMRSDDAKRCEAML